MTPVGLVALATFLDTMSLDRGGPARTAIRAAASALQGADGGDAQLPAASTPGKATGATTALFAPVFADAGETTGRPMLSGLAQLISRIAAGASQAVPLPTALLPSLHTDADAVPEAIRNAVQASGLFYESHLEDWVSGRRSLEQLRMEPQGAIPVRAAPNAPAQVPHLAIDARRTMDAQLPQATSARAPAETEIQASRAGPAAWTPPAVLEPVIREQLAALAQGSASVPIAPWPGQQALLTVHEEPQPDGQQRGEAGGEQTGGRLGLKMTLPQLGEVTFMVSAQGDRIRVDARTAHPASGDVLEARAAELREALAARSLALDALRVDASAP